MNKLVEKHPIAAKSAAILLLVAGYFFKTFVLDFTPALIDSLITTLIWGIGTALLCLSGKKIRPLGWAFLISALILPLSAIFSATPDVAALAMLASVVTYLSGVLCAFAPGVCEANLFRVICRAVFVTPFTKLGAWITCLFPGEGKKVGKGILYVFLGLFAAVLPTFLVIALLSYDGNFVKILRSISLGNILSFAWDLIFTFLFALITFGDLAASMEEVSVEGGSLVDGEFSALLPPVVSCAFALPIFVVYIIFFTSQWGYYVSAFTGKLPEGLNYADYARDGFFQLYAVTAINVLILFALNLLTKKREGKTSAAVRVINLCYALATLVLLGTALSKMILYVSGYGLTKLRVLTTACMIFTALGIVFFIILQFVKKLPLRTLLTFSGLILLMFLSFADVDARIAQYNVNAYLSGDLPTVDVMELAELSDGALPYTVLLEEHMDKLPADMQSVLRHHLKEAREEKLTVENFNIPTARALAALEE